MFVFLRNCVAANLHRLNIHFTFVIPHYGKTVRADMLRLVMEKDAPFSFRHRSRSLIIDLGAALGIRTP
jgi:hypothetical protein